MEEVKPAPWQTFTLVDAYQPRPPTVYIVDKLITEESLSLMYAQPAGMKSMLLADMCCAIVGGHDWLPGSSGSGGGIPVLQVPVLWVDMDNGTRRTHERFAALGRGHNLDENAPLYYLSMPSDPILHLTNSTAPFVLIDTIRESGAKLVVIDNLGLITGDVEENSAGMAQIMGYLRIVAERTGAAVLVIHHQRKGGANGGRAGEALRGHSSIEASLDLALHVTREPDTGIVTIKSTKTRGVDVPTIRARFNFEHYEGTHDLSLAWFDGLLVNAGDNPVADAIVEALEEYGKTTKTKLVHRVYDALMGETARNRIRSWIDEMLNVSGELVSEKGANNGQVISLKD